MPFAWSCGQVFASLQKALELPDAGLHTLSPHCLVMWAMVL